MFPYMFLCMCIASTAESQTFILCDHFQEGSDSLQFWIGSYPYLYILSTSLRGSKLVKWTCNAQQKYTDENLAY